MSRKSKFDSPQAEPSPDWTSDPAQVALFETRLQAIKLSRRHYLGLGGIAGTALLAACGDSATPTSATGNTAATPIPITISPRAGLATLPSGSGDTTNQAAATPGAATTGEVLATDQTIRLVNFSASDPTSHDFNKDLYCGGEPLLFAGLLKFTPDFEVAPGAAQRFEVKDNGATYIFYLNPQGRWTNGDPVTADDFVYSFTRQLDPATGASYAGFLYDIKNAVSFNTKKGATAGDLGLKAVDKFTLQITLEGPRAYFPTLMGFPASLPSHQPSVEKFGDKWTEAANIVSNGPFKLTSWDHNKQFVIERNEDYALGPKPKLQKVIYKIISDQVGLLPYENDELDLRNYNGVPSTEIPRIRKDPKLSKELIITSANALWYLEPVANKPPFDNKAVRQAVLKAIDREKLIGLINGLGQPAYTLIPPDMPAYIDPAKFPEYKTLSSYDPKAALEALKGTPYEGGKNWPKITLSLAQAGSTANTVTQFIQQQLKENLGIDLTLEALETRVFRERLFKNQHQFVYISWSLDYPDPNNFYYLVWYSKIASGKRHYYSNPTYDDLVSKAAGEIDSGKRLELYRQAEKILLDDAAYVPLYYPYATALAKPWVKGVPLNRSGQPVLDGSIFRGMKESLYLLKK